MSRPFYCSLCLSLDLFTLFFSFLQWNHSSNSNSFGKVSIYILFKLYPYSHIFNAHFYCENLKNFLLFFSASYTSWFQCNWNWIERQTIKKWLEDCWWHCSREMKVEKKNNNIKTWHIYHWNGMWLWYIHDMKMNDMNWLRDIVYELLNCEAMPLRVFTLSYYHSNVRRELFFSHMTHAYNTSDKDRRPYYSVNVKNCHILPISHRQQFINKLRNNTSICCSESFLITIIIIISLFHISRKKNTQKQPT